MTAGATGGCPVDHGALAKAAEKAPELECLDGVWHVRGYQLTRELLRVAEGFEQAGFNADFLSRAARGVRLPMLYENGARHRELRTASSRFFAPRTVEQNYLPLIQRTAEHSVQAMLAEGSSDFSNVAFEFSVRIAAAVLGLDASSPLGLGRRLSALLTIPFGAPGVRMGARRWFWLSAMGQFMSARIYLCDVLPVVRARRKEPREDVVSHLISIGYSHPEILTEVVMYGAAGVVTTREFMQIALWQLLQDDALRRRFMAADRGGRYRILAEILRVEPVVRHLYRRLDRDVSLTVDGVAYRFSKGDLIDFQLRDANLDPVVFGPGSAGLDPDRSVSQGVRAEGMSFGEGAHRCPGNALALAEVEALLVRLLAEDVRVEQSPQVRWGNLVAGHELSGLRLRVSARA